MSHDTLPRRADYRFAERLRVRWAEVDMQKIVFNAHYLMYLDTAIAGYWRALALPYQDSMHALGGDLYVRKATLEYHASACYDDQVEVGIRCQRVGNSSMLLRGAVFRDGVLLVHGDLVYVFADPASQTSRPVPPLLREVLEGFERGEPMIELPVGDWGELGASAGPVRHAVFTQEQGIDAALDHDGLDADALHVVARNRLGMVLGTGRLLTLAPGVGKIGRMAVIAAMRGSQVGRRMLHAL
ncbi:MAG: YbgC/FadM family acyl-CoA thioesterase, partial [Aquincola sp.]|nr:YbgC/FadM family acyl-CoA thioesterase [Aquincola sp.]